MVVEAVVVVVVVVEVFIVHTWVGGAAGQFIDILALVLTAENIENETDKHSNDL